MLFVVFDKFGFGVRRTVFKLWKFDFGQSRIMKLLRKCGVNGLSLLWDPC